MKVKMIVLANSWKHDPYRCVAGRTIVDTGKEFSIGDWIRPTGMLDHEGALHPDEIVLDTGRAVKVWDFVELSVSANPKNSGQPENRPIDAVKWRSLTSKYSRPPLADFEETPADLWLQPNVKTDRVAAAYLVDNPPGQSLYCVRPSEVSLLFETNRWGKARKRTVFSYNGVKYDLGLTDPVAVGQYCPRIPRQGEEPITVQLNPADTLLCVSLAGAFEGFHYKLVATVLT